MGDSTEPKSMTRRDFLKIAATGGAAAGLSALAAGGGKVLEVLSPQPPLEKLSPPKSSHRPLTTEGVENRYPRSLEFLADLSAAKGGLEQFLAQNPDLPPPLLFPLHPAAAKDLLTANAFFFPGIDREVLTLAEQSVRKEVTGALNAKEQVPDAELLARLDNAGSENSLNLFFNSEPVQNGDYTFLSHNSSKFNLNGVMKRWNRKDDQELSKTGSPEKQTFVDPDLERVYHDIITTLNLPWRASELESDGGTLGLFGAGRIRIDTDGLEKLDQPTKETIFALIALHEFTHGLDIWNNPDFLKYLRGESGLTRLLKLRSGADGLMKIATQGYTIATALPVLVREQQFLIHPQMFIKGDFDSESLENSLLVYPAALYIATVLGRKNAFPRLENFGGSYNLQAYLADEISAAASGLTVASLRQGTWREQVDPAKIPLFAAALDSRPDIFNEVMFPDGSQVLSLEIMADMAANTAAISILTGKYTGPLPLHVLTEFYWKLSSCSGEYLAHIGSLYLYAAMGFDLGPKTDEVKALFANNEAAIRYLELALSSLDPARITGLMEKSQAKIGRFLPQLKSAAGLTNKLKSGVLELAYRKTSLPDVEVS